MGAMSASFREHSKKAPANQALLPQRHRAALVPTAVEGSMRVAMPRISAFYGIVIWMYHDEAHHIGRPHFHARYGDDEASMDIAELTVIAGRLPHRARRLVVEWARLHRDELEDNWDRARRHEPLKPIEPLR
jgi:hypothetical protein